MSSCLEIANNQCSYLPMTEHEKDANTDLLELSYVRLLHMLSHHPDFGTDLESLQLFAKYIDFFLETIATSENISYLYIVSGQLKVVRDTLSESSDVSLVADRLPLWCSNKDTSLTQRVFPNVLYTEPLSAQRAVSIHYSRQESPNGMVSSVSRARPPHAQEPFQTALHQSCG